MTESVARDDVDSGSKNIRVPLLLSGKNQYRGEEESQILGDIVDIKIQRGYIPLGVRLSKTNIAPSSHVSVVSLTFTPRE